MQLGIGQPRTTEGSIKVRNGTLPSDFKILAVDDSPLYRKLVEQSLQQEQYTVLAANNGGEALRLFAEHRPAVVITDWTMPDITGPDLCRRIRSDFPDDYCHLILLTSNNDTAQVVQGLQSGADDYLTKPFQSDELIARVGVGRRISDLHRDLQAKNRLLEQMALTDPLTDLPNRRAIDVWAPRQLSAAARHHFPLWIVLADLDFFKTINDSYGHDAGDCVLKDFAKILKANTRHSDMCGRLGGEEFLLILSHSERNDVTTAIERLRKQIESTKFHFGKTSISITTSFGVAKFFGTEAPELETLVSCADTALYAAKEKGRNRIEFAD